MIVLELIFMLLLLLGLFYGSYLALFAVAGLRYRTPSFEPAEKLHRIAVLIPAYKEDQVIVETAQSALRQSYPSAHYDVFVISDGLSFSTIKTLLHLPVSVIQVAFESSTKVKALRAAIREIDPYGYDAVTILDADNQMQGDFLARANGGLNLGFDAIQGCREAKNANTAMARLDGLTEAINTHVFRKGHQVLGLPSALTGSGMTFSMPLFKEFILESKAVGGFDKELELVLAKAGTPILYDDLAIVRDEKVAHMSHLKKQRARWMGAQWHYAKASWIDSVHTWIVHRNVPYLNKAFQMILPPRILLILAQLALLFVAALSGSLLFLGMAAAGIAATIIAMVVSTPSGLRTVLIKDFRFLPLAAWAYASSILKSISANRAFIHTPHQH